MSTNVNKTDLLLAAWLLKNTAQNGAAVGLSPEVLAALERVTSFLLVASVAVEGDTLTRLLFDPAQVDVDLAADMQPVGWWTNNPGGVHVTVTGRCQRCGEVRELDRTCLCALCKPPPEAH